MQISGYYWFSQTDPYRPIPIFLPWGPQIHTFLWGLKIWFLATCLSPLCRNFWIFIRSSLGVLWLLASVGFAGCWRCWTQEGAQLCCLPGVAACETCRRTRDVLCLCLCGSKILSIYSAGGATVRPDLHRAMSPCHLTHLTRQSTRQSRHLLPYPRISVQARNTGRARMAGVSGSRYS